MKISQFRIAPKLGVLVAVAMIGLLAAGVFAASILQSEMRKDRLEQIRTVADVARNMAIGLRSRSMPAG